MSCPRTRTKVASSCLRCLAQVHEIQNGKIATGAAASRFFSDCTMTSAALGADAADKELPLKAPLAERGHRAWSEPVSHDLHFLPSCLPRLLPAPMRSFARNVYDRCLCFCLRRLCNPVDAQISDLSLTSGLLEGHHLPWHALRSPKDRSSLVRTLSAINLAIQIAQVSQKLPGMISQCHICCRSFRSNGSVPVFGRLAPDSQGSSDGHP